LQTIAPALPSLPMTPQVYQRLRQELQAEHGFNDAAGQIVAGARFFELA
jgi:hypothetical protein